MNGYAYVPDPTEPNKLTVNLPVSLANSTLFYNNGNYQVIDTDYKQYALVYSCTPIPLINEKDEIVWILSRSKKLDAGIVTKLKEKISSMGLPTKPFVVVDQSC